MSKYKVGDVLAVTGGTFNEDGTEGYHYVPVGHDVEVTSTGGNLYTVRPLTDLDPDYQQSIREKDLRHV